MPKFAFLILILATATIAASGCTHRMNVRNLDEFSLTAHTARRHTVRLAAPTSGPTEPYAEMIRSGLTKHGSVGEVVLAGAPAGVDRPDVDVSAAVSVTYKGSGANYPITFPGFLLFTHAWNGYVYKADIATDLTVTNLVTGQTHTRSLTTEYDMRHCDFGRGFWSSSGWFLPGWGATSLISGLFMISYDTDATPNFLPAVHDAYGDYIANNVVAMLAEDDAVPRLALGSPQTTDAIVTPKPPASPAPFSPPSPIVKVAEPVATSSVKAAQPKVEMAAPVAANDDDAYNARIWSDQEKHTR